MRTTNDRLIETTDESRTEQLGVVMNALSRGLESLGELVYVAVILDPRPRGDDTGRLFCVANVENEAKMDLLKTYLAIAENPLVEKKTYEVPNRSFAPSLPN